MALYREKCKETNKNPTYAGLGRYLNISANTVRHVVSGYYKKNQPYGKKEHATRCIANSDFEIVKALYKANFILSGESN